VRACVWHTKLRCGTVERHGAENVEDLHKDVIVAAGLSERERAIGERRDGVVVGASKQQRDADAQCKRGIREVAPPDQAWEYAMDRGIRIRIAPLEIRELRAPHVHPKHRPRIVLNRVRGLCCGFELADGFPMVASAHRAECACETQFDAGRGHCVRRFA
jgi:hypothetical protein